MSDQNRKENDALNSLSNRDTIELPDDLSLSDSDSDEPIEHFGSKVEDLSSSSEDEDETPQHVQSVPQENPTFRLTGGSSGFCDRSRDIFAQLDSAAKLTSKDLGEDNILDGTFARPAPPSPPPPAAKRKCGQETTKKQPPGKKLPDYLGRPERWTHYSLEDVAETSDRENSQVAHQYIQGLQDSRRSQKDALETFTPAFNQDHGSTSENKIVFAKPKIKDQSGSKLDHAKKEEVELQHLDDRQETDEGEDASLHHHLSSWENKEKKRKWGTEKEDDDKKVSYVVFNSSKKVKVNRKFFRKTLEDDEGGTE
ncbi:protein TSSC4-like [Sinocyclocheilus rhinocerous]|uniref:protein TSSC4-like n=1 Tax=Sinocyclocheilus rhinocerous TaxID=307959 RepID=UPI0007B972A2|nr:PREDICTED: protein TSSC4-like [Sinocyclocheilus rhinocerous]XP_016427222.1 PREDICTED: protein TSSC4-like [Sinocyclocheilus rhinocerous]XP_016427223.1 PREDICTED: protein TSSC4-like [Sinocyclocheilus rhinocerous]XP_016427224.1 PREDICTED: protein TSSC4-like [Sinocyclocheilus rhinocerous]XP_016427225.1 PREDICTED: protein TSSC4-like [Sinocyclocheilus rhinocerous]XP_016427226.1 PREDICTED: protein TSSC4-like [Sinocyclocheilus rhinocerous]